MNYLFSGCGRVWGNNRIKSGAEAVAAKLSRQSAAQTKHFLFRSKRYLLPAVLPI